MQLVNDMTSLMLFDWLYMEWKLWWHLLNHFVSINSLLSYPISHVTPFTHADEKEASAMLACTCTCVTWCRHSYANKVYCWTFDILNLTVEHRREMYYPPNAMQSNRLLHKPPPHGFHWALASFFASRNSVLLFEFLQCSVLLLVGIRILFIKSNKCLHKNQENQFFVVEWVFACILRLSKQNRRESRRKKGEQI